MMGTRITGGRERGRRVRSTSKSGLRPTTERVRAAIFSMIGPDAVGEARVLDLYAGTGALGIEALSRGASWADFVEMHAGRCKDIRESLSQMDLADQAHVFRMKVERALDALRGGYDLVLVDPPYDTEPWEQVMERLQSARLLNEGALVIVEHYRASKLAERYGGLLRRTQRRHGDTSVSIYRFGGAVA